MIPQHLLYQCPFIPQLLRQVEMLHPTGCRQRREQSCADAERSLGSVSSKGEQVRVRIRKVHNQAETPLQPTPNESQGPGQLCAVALKGSKEAPAGFSPLFGTRLFPQHSGPRLHPTVSGQTMNTGSQTCRTVERGCRVSWWTRALTTHCPAQPVKNINITWSADKRTWVQTWHKGWQCERSTICTPAVSGSGQEWLLQGKGCVLLFCQSVGKHFFLSQNKTSTETQWQSPSKFFTYNLKQKKTNVN